MKFASPLYLLFLLIPAIYLFLKYSGFGSIRNVSLNPTLLFSSRDLFPKKNGGLAGFYQYITDGLLCLAMVFLTIALARPLGGHSISSDQYYGVDIILAIDVSGSMLNVDFIPSNLSHREVMGRQIYFDGGHTLIPSNRVNSAKKVILDYVNKQTYNRIGVVLFAGYSYTKCPLTLDKNMLASIIKDIQFASDNDGTAIGMGVATSVNRLKKSNAKSKLIILLTDGNNNMGMIDPMSAAAIARDRGIKIYTIGLGNPEAYLQPVSAEFNEYVLQMGSGIDEKTLGGIADTTGGKFYRAYDANSLQRIYEDIDRLEKSRIDVKRRVLYKENFMPFLAIGLFLLALYIGFTGSVTRIP